MNDMEQYRDALGVITPWRGSVPQGYLVDFLGTLTKRSYQKLGVPDGLGGRDKVTATKLPTIGNGRNGEGWFEAINWLDVARNARDRFVMISLGAHYGAQLVGAHRMLQLVNPMPSTLVAVEGEPQNYAWISDHMRDNEIDPDAHWLIPMAINDTNEPVLFPIGAPGTGANNCFSTNQENSRRIYADIIMTEKDVDETLLNLFMSNTTGLSQPVNSELPYSIELKFVSSVTLADVLGPFDFVDYVESDIQQSEIVVFPPFIDILTQKVRRIHLGTHGKDVHWDLHRLFADNGWNIVFSFEPNAEHDCALGRFVLNDGILTVENPRFC